MFRENSAHNQFSMFESTNWMSPRIKEKLQKSWAPVFYEHVFCKIDEKPFAVLYSDVGRPNFPVNISISLEFIKHFLNYSDDDLIDNYYFNYLVNYAVGIRTLGELNLAERTMYEFRDRIYKYTLEHPEEDDLIFTQFINLLNEFAKVTGISFKEQRMDSTMFMSNIKKAGRLSLAFDVLMKAVKALPENNLVDTLKDVLKPEFRTKTLFKTKASETKSKLNYILNLCFEAQELLKNVETKKATEALRIVSRFITEQADFDINTKKLTAKKSVKISSNSLQSAHDEDATFRKKSGKNHSGYVANLSETCSKENPYQLITDYTIDKNIKSDVDFMEERLPIIVENTGCEKLYVDGGYYSEKASNISPNVEINFTDMTGKKPVEKIPVTDFEFDETNIIIKCPKGIAPDRSVIKKGQSVAHFPIDCCKSCEYRDKCQAKAQKKSYVVRISSTALEAALQRLKIQQNKIENVSARAGIEGTNSALKRSQHFNKLYVRGIAKCKVVGGLKITAQNIRRFIKQILTPRNPKPRDKGTPMPNLT